jgi:hypothetical protein
LQPADRRSPAYESVANGSDLDPVFLAPALRIEEKAQ